MIQNTPAGPPLHIKESESLDFYLIQMLWHDLKQAVCAQTPSSV